MHMMRCDSVGFQQFGEVYFSLVKPGVVKGWKRHTEMTQNVTVPHGNIKLVIVDCRDGSATYNQSQTILLGRPTHYFRVTIPPRVWYAFQAIKTAFNNKWLLGVYSLIVVLVLGNFFWQFFGYDRTEGWTHAIAYAIGFFVALASLQIVLFSLLFLEDVLRLLKGCVDFFSKKSFDIQYRRKFISQIAIGLGAGHTGSRRRPARIRLLFALATRALG